MESPASDDLVRRIRERDGEALASFLETNRDRLTGFLKAISSERLRSVVELDDLFQEIAAAALSGLPTAPLDRYEPMEWLRQLARRRVVDAHRFHFQAQRRNANRQQSLHGNAPADASAVGLEALLAASMTSPSAALSRDARLGRLEQAVSEMPEEQQTAIRLRYAEGLPTKEVAERLGKTDVAVRVLLSRCMRQLEKQLADVRPTPRH